MGTKDIAINRKARHDYIIEETLEAGLVLQGTEIKSLRKGKVQLKESYISFSNGEAFVKGMSISQYENGTYNNHEETRERKLLLHKSQIKKFYNKVKMQGYTVIPTKIYLVNGKAKIEIALAKGKTLYDKRQTDKERSIKREIQKATRR